VGPFFNVLKSVHHNLSWLDFPLQFLLSVAQSEQQKKSTWEQRNVKNSFVPMEIRWINLPLSPLPSLPWPTSSSRKYDEWHIGYIKIYRTRSFEIQKLFTISLTQQFESRIGPINQPSGSAQRASKSSGAPDLSLAVHRWTQFTSEPQKNERIISVTWELTPARERKT